MRFVWLAATALLHAAVLAEPSLRSGGSRVGGSPFGPAVVPQFSYDGRHTGRSSLPGPVGPAVRQAWQQNGPSMSYVYSSPTMAGDGTVYLNAAYSGTASWLADARWLPRAPLSGWLSWRRRLADGIRPKHR